ncbi:MAG: DUF5652 family protein [Candidatus Daviesbacteria bacterium]|nr:DUF5652 family protein [Candidatus Daviesbacteria bacterium]
MMGNYFYPMYNSMFYWMSGWNPFIWLAPLALIDLILKGFALWKAGRNNHLYWFIALLFINSLGILPLIYLVFFEKKNKK